MKEISIAVLVGLFVLWWTFSIAISASKTAKDNCGKKYPIGYLFYDEWFCEIKE